MDVLWQGITQAGQLIAQGDPELRRIVALSLVVSALATVLAAAIGIPAGVALAVGQFRGRGVIQALVNTGMGLPPVVVGLVLTLLLWRTGPFGFLGLLYTPGAMVSAQFIVAAPIAAGFTQAALELLEPELIAALRVDGAAFARLALELCRAALPQVLVAVAAAFGRAIAEVGASLMVGGNILGQTRTLTTTITLVTSRGDFGLAIALGIILLAVALMVNAGLTWRARAAVAS
ncbi:MAG TPA: ABC transporter permease [Chloroflexota bacterium]|jgi:tungstate transport system permease protein|nr:ABC transporter permease [Chloroflexota bacterium]